MLAAGEIVPVPGGAALVVLRDLLDSKRPALSEFRREHDLREFRRQGLRQIDHADFSGHKVRRQ
jgi:hypothetical protein